MLTWFIVIFTFDLPAWLMLVYWFAMQVFGGFGQIADRRPRRAAPPSSLTSAASSPASR